METYIVMVTVNPGHEEEVARFYRDLEPLLGEADGFRGRRIFRAQTGAMAAGVRKLYTEEELSKHTEPPHQDPGTRFVVIEHWDSIEQRLLFSKNVMGSRTRDLIPHLLPGHSHEFYEDLSAGQTDARRPGIIEPVS